MLDLILRNGTVFDGTGAEGFRADVGIQDEWIREIGDLSRAPAQRALDCTRLYVTPGFIDMHTHSDLDLFIDPQSSPKVRMGVTLELLGQDGISVVPMRPENVPQVKVQLSGILGDHPMEWQWQRVGDYLRLLHRRTTVNVAYLVPHGALRWWVMGFDARTATPQELDAMCALLRESIQEGAVGVSTGLIYPPCVYADWKELVALATTAAKAGGFWVVHIRNEGDRSEEALREMVDLARASGCPLHVSHFKVSGRDNFHRADGLAAMMERAIQDGIEVTCDQYPYTAGCTVLGACLPPWAHDGGASETLKRLRNLADRARMREEIEGPPRGMWQSTARAATYDGIVISTVGSAKNRTLVGRSLTEIARIRKVEPVEALFDLLLEEGMKVAMIVHSQSEEVVAKFMRLPFQTVGTDGIRGAKPHPRLYGTYPRALGRYVRDKRVLTWREAIAHMTGAAAKRLGASDQGLIRAGMRGSITVFDPDRIIDRATYEEPTREPEGIQYVLVNGQIALENGVETGILAGRVCGKTW
ncbi:MAG: amidohydrolase family protein [Candidatus Methylomirabilales bacterium]